MRLKWLLLSLLLFTASAADAAQWGTGALMVVVEREKGAVMVLDAAQNHKVLGEVGGLGILHHASAVFSRDGRYVYLVSRDGLLSKIDLLGPSLAAQVKVGDSSIGLAVTTDGKHVAVSNYKPGNIVIVDDASFKAVKSIEADASRTVGLVDAPGNLLIVALMDANEIWIIDAGNPDFPVVKKYADVGVKPYDGMITSNGRYYMAGFFHSEWVAIIDLWDRENVVKLPLPRPGYRLEEAPPVLKLPHLRGWTMSDGHLFTPIVGVSGLAVISTRDWTIEKTVDLAAYPVFTVLRPDGRQLWVNYAMGEKHDTMQVIDLKTMTVSKTLKPGAKVFHMQFTPKGNEIYASVNGEDKVVIYNTDTFEVVKQIAVPQPSGIFCSNRSSLFGM